MSEDPKDLRWRFRVKDGLDEPGFIAVSEEELSSTSPTAQVTESKLLQFTLDQATWLHTAIGKALTLRVAEFIYQDPKNPDWRYRVKGGSGLVCVANEDLSGPDAEVTESEGLIFTLSQATWLHSVVGQVLESYRTNVQPCRDFTTCGNITVRKNALGEPECVACSPRVLSLEDFGADAAFSWEDNQRAIVNGRYVTGVEINDEEIQFYVEGGVGIYTRAEAVAFLRREQKTH